MSKHEVNLGFQFVIPADELLAHARFLLGSESQDERDAAKALLDTTSVSQQTQAEIASGRECDLAKYFDHWIGDAIEAANRLLASKERLTRDLVETLLSQSKAIIESKENFLKEAKRVKLPRKPD